MELEELSLIELREKAKDEGIKNTTKFKKEELISILKEKLGQDKPNASTENTEFKEVITEEGYKLTSEGDEVVGRNTRSST